MRNRNELTIRTPIWIRLVYVTLGGFLALGGHGATGEHGLLGALQIGGLIGKIALFSVIMYGLMLLSAVMIFFPRKITIGPRGITEKMPGKTLSLTWSDVLQVGKGASGTVVQTPGGTITLGQGVFVSNKVLKAIKSFSSQPSLSTKGSARSLVKGQKRAFGAKTRTS